MNIQDAAHLIGHEYPGGAQAMADRMGIVRAVFNSKLNPNTTTHHLTVVEALRMQQLAGRYDILFSMAESCGFVCVPMPGDIHENIDRDVARMIKEFGDYIGRVSDAIEDGRVTPNELKRCEKELSEMMAAANALQAALAAMSANQSGRLARD